MLKNLLEQANEHVVKVNKLIGQVEDFDNILGEVNREGSKVCIYSGVGTTFVDLVLNANIMDGLKVTLLESIEKEKGKKVEELQSLVKVNIVHEKKDIVHKGEDIVIQKTEDVIEKPKNVELTVDIVKEIYLKRGLTLDEAAKELGISKTSLHAFITKNNLKKPSKKDKEIFLDTKVSIKKERP